MFEKFGEYMYYLLNTPLKKGKKNSNQLYIFLKVIGKLFDDTKKDILKVRDESMVISASPIMLPVHGQDIQMDRLKNEDVEAYRTRLSMKAIVAEKAGSEEGILLALAALGYEKSYIEPMWKQEAERWAEFVIYLQGKNQSSVNDLRVIDIEIMKVKQASSKPSYGVGSNSGVVINTKADFYPFEYPICNVLVCGTYPDEAVVGKNLESVVIINTQYKGLDNDKYRCNTFNAGEVN